MARSGPASAAARPGDLVRLLDQAVEQAPTLGVGYVGDAGPVSVETYPDLLRRAACMLAGLRRRGLRPGDHVVLALAGNETFLAAFWGCVLGGFIPAPVAAPTAPTKSALASERLLNVRQVLGNPCVIVDAAASAADGDRDRWWSFAELAADSPDYGFHRPDPSDTAFIQFSSGSTGQPKGVILTHRNVVANLAAIHEGLGSEPDDVGVNWMPLYHDLGLVGFHLAPLYYRRPQYHLHPATMIRRPLLWLDTLERHRGTITACPNFGQTLVLSRLERDRGRRWDLSSVRLILNGAEPIAAPLMRRFQAELARFGVRESAMMPVYGMAEATLGATFSPAGLPPRVETLDRQGLQRDGRALPAAPEDLLGVEAVGVGLPVQGCAVRIVDGSDQLLADDAIGHVQVRGDNLTGGYVADRSATEAAFCGPWFRTGDLGFQRGGWLFVTGRAKDVLFVNGQNFYAHDLEQIAGQVEGVPSGKVAVCGSHDSKEERERLLLFIACSNPSSAAPLFAAINRHFQTTLGLSADVMIPLESRQLPKTTSGKLQRYRLRELFEQGAFGRQISELSQALAALEQRAAKIAPRTATEALLLEIWSLELRLPPDQIGVDEEFEHLGGTSLQALRVLCALEERLGLKVHSGALADHSTIAALGAYLDRHGSSLTGPQTASANYFRG